MVRLLIEDVTLAREERTITAQVRFKAGQTITFQVRVGPPAYDIRRTAAETVTEIDRLLDHHTDAEVAAELNRRGFTSGTDQAFTPTMVNHIRRKYRLDSQYVRLRRQGLLTLNETAQALGVHPQTVKKRAATG